GGGGTTYVPPKVNTEPDKRSADNNLAGLSVSQGKLSPDFSAEVTKYRVEAGPNLKEISIDAKATDAKASVSGTGKKELKVGDNSFDIICTAENTVTKTYNVVVHVDEKPLVYLKVNGKELGVVRDLQGISIPEGFNATKIKIKKHEIDAWKNASGKTLVYLMDKKGNKNFYLYDQKKGVTSIYIPITLAGHNLALIDISDAKKDRNDMKYVENILVDNHKIPGWIFNDENKKDFSLHLFMNEKGEKVYYQYDNKENILQRYIETEENPGAVFGDIITYVSIGLAGLFAIAFVVAMMKNARLKKSLTRKTRSLYEPEEISGDNSYEETKNDNKITDENIEN
ncbi:MAG: cadherin-like beta sandwich domain-containing protein, partial [Erysipelotrichaceae bacterium]